MEESRCTQMTKRLIKEALIELMDRKSYDRINVKELCEAADVNRSTFYAHYEGIDQVLREIENDVFAKIPPQNLNKGKLEDQLMGLFVPFFEYVKKNVRIFRVLLRDPDSSEFIQRWIQAAFEKFKDYALPGDVTFQRYTYIYAVSGVAGMLREWVKEDCAMDSRDFSDLVLRVAFSERAA